MNYEQSFDENGYLVCKVTIRTSLGTEISLDSVFSSFTKNMMKVFKEYNVVEYRVRRGHIDVLIHPTLAPSGRREGGVLRMKKHDPEVKDAPALCERITREVVEIILDTGVGAGNRTG